jgi:hypothetical protein
MIFFSLFRSPNNRNLQISPDVPYLKECCLVKLELGTWYRIKFGDSLLPFSSVTFAHAFPN